MKVGIAGYGKVGKSLAAGFDSLQILDWILIRNLHKFNAEDSNLKSGFRIYQSFSELNNLPDFIFLSVADSQIAQAATELANTDADKSNCCLVHLSGFKTLNELDSAAQAGFKTAALHPYQTFFYPEKTNLKGIAWAAESDDSLQPRLKQLIGLLGGNIFFIEQNKPELKAIYHSSAVAASNYAAALLEISQSLLKSTGLDPKYFILPIIEQTIENVILNSSANDFPLTGPIARGDTEAMKMNVQAAMTQDASGSAFLKFTEATAAVAYHKNIISRDTYLAITEMLRRI